ncbi:Triphosphoribosyl-dephospho-CoA synthetase [Cystobacter fuscus DSM 2262]|uniref:triphosphoribosyl-dephospho-CoA synthase n=1 Tax=Cystobacter fuscus (strain ATCC 25194 / DSM 2262 / NBRC 100088 / M29) TaxID=1242864 RepID=S9QGT8_CYSF2|nr:triphosphoribosyl-dephospho-CoA synthase [Cystobacter fuscus]EPX55588.1 Triphosphoribosyl-dephospho-CoA synthetase [Cystobacter fuscus DSM 2262]
MHQQPYAELALHPKPGLVSPLDSGSHDDMDMGTFMRSLFSLRGYFRDIAAAGAGGADFPVLRALGLDAERRMLAATGGINTHRGALFSLVRAPPATRGGTDMSLGILCPGQGAQHPAMLEPLSTQPEARAVLDAASEVLGASPWTLMKGPAEALYVNALAQPLLCAVQLATWTALRSRLPTPRVFAGYSVG